MKSKTAYGLIVSGLIVLFAAAHTAAATPDCGGDGQPKCTFARATFEGKAKGCGKGTFPAYNDETKQIECWSCPEHFVPDPTRKITSKHQCVRPPYVTTHAGHKHGKATLGCPSGQFASLLDGGGCFACDPGYHQDSQVKAPSDHHMCKKPGHTTHYAGTRHKKAIAGICPKHQWWSTKDGYCYSCPEGTPDLTKFGDDSHFCSRKNADSYRPAKHKGDVSFGCPGGQWPSTDNGHCYSCPEGSTHTGVTFGSSDGACAKSHPAAYEKATYHNALVCPKGQFADPRNGGECWSCPEDYDRSMFTAVDKPKSCTIRLAKTCDGGNVLVGDHCFTKDVCGKEGQRPCLAWEHVPSCDPHLKEDFGHNVCRKLKKGESPFTGGLKSALHQVAKLRDVCHEKLNLYQDVAANPPQQSINPLMPPPDPSTEACQAGMLEGFICAPPALADELAGAISGTEWVIHKLVHAPETIHKLEVDGGKLAIELWHRYQNRDCNNLPDKLAYRKAHFVKKAPLDEGGMWTCDPAKREFYDPRKGGECWRCPKHTDRTAWWPVNGRKACEVPGATSLKTMCSIMEFATGKEPTADEAIASQCLLKLTEPESMGRILVGTHANIPQRELCERFGDLAFSLMLGKALMEKAKQSETAAKESIEAAKFIGKTESIATYKRKLWIAKVFKTILTGRKYVKRGVKGYKIGELIGHAFYKALDEEMNRRCPEL